MHRSLYVTLVIFFVFCSGAFRAAIDTDLVRSWADTLVQVTHEAGRLDEVGKPFITFFGGHRLGEDDPFYKKAYDLAKKLAEHGFAVITGGGGGLMKAGNCGAASVKGQGITSVGFGVVGLDEGAGLNSCVQLGALMPNFFSRKWLFRYRAEAFVIFPGGFGTIDELSEILTLMHTHQMPVKPIFVMGREYWNGFLKDWVIGMARKKGLIGNGAIKLFTITDDVDEILEKILSVSSQKQGVES